MNSALVKNWATFQHYKDRSPPWIKLHRALLDNMDYHLLSPIAAKALPLLWLIASESEGALPDADTLAFRLRTDCASAQAIVTELIARKFLVAAGAEHAEQPATPAQPRAEQWGSRHIPQKVRIAVWNRDGGCCVWCKSTENVEYDHIIPISKNGQSTEENLQLLCRSCNRKKRVATPAQPPAKNAEPRDRDRDRDRERVETEKEKDSERQAARFAEFWSVYPNRKGKAEAEKKWKARKLDAIADQIIADVRSRITNDRDWLRGFIPHGSTYVNAEGWNDGLPPADVPAKNGKPEPVCNPLGPSPQRPETAEDRAAAKAAFERSLREFGVAQ